MAKCKHCGEKLDGGFLGLGGKCHNPKCVNYYCDNLGMDGVEGFVKKKADRSETFAVSGTLESISTPPLSGCLDYHPDPMVEHDKVMKGVLRGIMRKLQNQIPEIIEFHKINRCIGLDSFVPQIELVYDIKKYNFGPGPIRKIIREKIVQRISLEDINLDYWNMVDTENNFNRSVIDAFTEFCKIEIEKKLMETYPPVGEQLTNKFNKIYKEINENFK